MLAFLRRKYFLFKGTKNSTQLPLFLEIAIWMLFVISLRLYLMALINKYTVTTKMFLQTIYILLQYLI